MRVVIVHSGEDGFSVAELPSLPGCINQGKAREEAITNIREAIQDWLMRQGNLAGKFDSAHRR